MGRLSIKAVTGAEGASKGMTAVSLKVVYEGIPHNVLLSIYKQIAWELLEYDPDEFDVMQEAIDMGLSMDTYNEGQDMLSRMLPKKGEKG